MKAQGLLAGMILGALVLAGVAPAQDVSVFSSERPEFSDRFGIQLTGGGSMFALDDINNYFQTTDYVGQVEADPGVGGGFALLYRSSEHFRWQIGYSWLGETTAKAIDTSDDESNGEIVQQTVSGSEIYLAGNYLFPLIEDFAIVSAGAGVSIVSASFDSNDKDIYGASGRELGGRVQLGAELKLTDMFSLSVLGGYRAANVPELQYEDLTDLDEDGNPIKKPLIWTGNRKLGVDFSGPFVEGGLRLYFKPATEWFEL
ncbi:MAG: hypothetical protein MAG453_00274 [Calditrichaeota bacterium]|nr:hypothetical protein [Calditrichota bacterium]